MKFHELHLDDPIRVRRLKHWFYAGLAILAAAEIAWLLIGAMGEAHFWFEDLPAWGSLSGFAACVAIIVTSKLLGTLWLTRPENYYDS